MGTTYNVRIYKIEVRRNAAGKVTSHRVRWDVDGKRFTETFKLDAQADSFRSDLVSAQRKGEAFDTESGLPVSLIPAPKWDEKRGEHRYDFGKFHLEMAEPHAGAMD